MSGLPEKEGKLTGALEMLQTSSTEQKTFGGDFGSEEKRVFGCFPLGTGQVAAQKVDDATMK